MSQAEIKDDVSRWPQTQDSASGDYNSSKYRPNEPSVYDAPVGTWEQAAIRQAVIVNTMPRGQVRRLVKPPLPQIAPRVPRRIVVDIYDVMDLDRNPADRRGYFSGTAAGYQGSTRNEAWGGPY